MGHLKYLLSAGGDRTGGTAAWGACLSASSVTSRPEGFLMETFFMGTKTLALALSEVDRVIGVDGGVTGEGGGADGCGGWR